jgi:MFS family permease
MGDDRQVTAGEPARQTVSAWAPFSHWPFALLWTATLISNIGTWMHNVGAGWLMTTLNPSPAIVALVQVATTLPIFLFALFAGAMADRLDRRRFLVSVNCALAVVVALMAALTVAGWMTPVLLLVFTFLIGTGAAFMAPAWQAVVPDLVPRETLQPAIGLNSMGINISRAVGPALAGFLITTLGLAAPFVANAASLAVIITALLIWKPPPRPAPTLPPEPVFGAMLTGIRHASRNKPLKATLVRAFGFFTFASAYWALLPLVARGLPGGGADLFGLLLAAIGAGAVIGALALPRIRRTFGNDALAAAGSAITAAAMIALGLAAAAPMAFAAAFSGGLGWIIVLTSLNVSAQLALPNWVRARGLALTLMVYFGCMAAGSALWGQVAEWTGIATALIAAAGGLVVAIPLTWRARLGLGERLDLTPAMSWADPVVAEGFDDNPDRGPVMITIAYEIDEADRERFLSAIHDLSGERYRDGAYQWGVYQDAADPRIWLEWFIVSSWAEHLRQHERVTRQDVDIQQRVRDCHSGEGNPVVHHYFAPAASPGASR